MKDDLGQRKDHYAQLVESETHADDERGFQSSLNNDLIQKVLELEHEL